MGALANAIRLTLSLLLGALFALLPLSQLAWRCAAACLRCRRSPLAAPLERRFPARLADARLGAHRWATVNGLRMHYVERGPSHGAPAAAPGAAATAPPPPPAADAAAPVLLCLHGFPEMWYSWRWFLLALSSRYRVVAPDLRGCGETSRGEASWWRAGDSRLAVLVADVHALVLALAPAGGRVTLVGHDWGAVIAHAYATAHPASVERLVVLNGPHPCAMWDARSLAQLARSFYIFVFQLPWLPELWLRADDLAFVRATLLGRALGARRRGEALCLDRRDAAAFAWSLSRAGGVTAAVNWYRAIFSHNVDAHAEIGMERAGSLPQTLLVWGDEDGALGRGDDAAAATQRYAPAGGFAAAIIPRCSHWVMQDAVLEALRAVAPFLGLRGLEPLEQGLRRSGAPAPPLPAGAPAMHDVAGFQPLVGEDED